jgi:hypothetical protein
MKRVSIRLIQITVGAAIAAAVLGSECLLATSTPLFFLT